MKLFYITIAASLIASNVMAADLNLSANSLKIRLYKFAVSTSPLCTNLQTIVDNGNSPIETQMLGGADLGSGQIANGNYPCVVIEMSDNIKYIPSTTSTSGNCHVGTEVSRDLCHNGDTSVKIDGTTTTCGTSTDDKVALYISTATSGTNGDAFNRPTFVGDTNHGNPLPTILTVGNNTSATFTVGTAGQVCDDNTAGCDGSSGGTGINGAGLCHLAGATFTFGN